MCVFRFFDYAYSKNGRRNVREKTFYALMALESGRSYNLSYLRPSKWG